jgi:hypothetical protein
MRYPVRIVSIEARDIRFPTSRLPDGSDAMYPVLRTDADDGLEFPHGRAWAEGGLAVGGH